MWLHDHLLLSWGTAKGGPLTMRLNMAIPTSVPAPMTARMISRMGERGAPSSGSALMRKAVIITSVIRPFQKICTTW